MDHLQGNHNKKSRRHFFLSRVCLSLMYQLCEKLGLSPSSIIELATRRMFEHELGSYMDEVKKARDDTALQLIIQEYDEDER